MSSEKSPSLTILKVRRTRKHVLISYRNGDEDHLLKSRDNPLPAFDQAITALAPLVCELVHLPEKYVENMRAVGVTVSDASGNDMVTVIAQKSLDDANGPFTIATPLRLMDTPTEEGSYSPPLSAKQAALINEVVEQAKEYIRGNRAQGQIQLNDDDDGSEDGEESDPNSGQTEMDEVAATK